MPDRNSLVSTLWLTSSLALLASMLTVPLRTSGFATVSNRPAYLQCDFAPPPGPPTPLLDASMATDAVARVSALPSESEEQDRAEALVETRVPFLIPGSFRAIPNRRLIAPRSIPSLYPLRC